MNYYKRHLGDYAKDTRHLSLAEHGAFCLLLDYYYSTEKPLPDDRCERIANAYAEHEREAVRNVLSAFFTLTDDGWRNARADEEISEFRAKSLKAKEAADARWSGRNADASANASETHGNTQCERNASHKPLTNKEKKPAQARSAGKCNLQTFLDDCTAAGEDPIPADDAVFAYADRIGLPRDYVALAWAWFKARYATKQQTGIKGWRQTFRNAVEGNWPKFWFADDAGGWGLTTAGKQAQRSQP